jgi:hypothetical protein
MIGNKLLNDFLWKSYGYGRFESFLRKKRFTLATPKAISVKSLSQPETWVWTFQIQFLKKMKELKLLKPSLRLGYGCFESIFR